MPKAQLRVFVDARMALHTGIGRYIKGHVEALCHERFHFTAGVNTPAEGAAIRESCDSAEIFPYVARVYGKKERVLGLRGPRRIRKTTDVFWYPQFNVPLILPPRSVLTIHDLIQFRFNQSTTSRFRAWSGLRVLQMAVLQAQKVVCVSDVTLRDLERVVPSVVSKAVVVGNGVSSRWSVHSQADAATVTRLVGDSPFLLAVGVKKAHKNYSHLLSVMNALGSDDQPPKLVLIGKKEPDWTRVVEDWRSAGGNQKHLIDLDEVSDSLLAAFYAKATALLMPSLYEGFGLPPLEAMAAGTPVICSDRGALPETVGDGNAIVLDPKDERAWVEAIRRISNDDAERARLIAAGHIRAAAMGWSNSSSRLAHVFEEVAASKSTAAKAT